MWILAISEEEYQTARSIRFLGNEVRAAKREGISGNYSRMRYREKTKKAMVN